MKKGYIIGFLVAIAFLVIGGFIGFTIGSLNAVKTQAELSKQQKDMQFRTESYAPTCEQLKTIGKPELIKKDNDYFIVHTTENYLVVFGFNAEAGKVPSTAWWGAGRKELMEQTCKAKK